MQCFSTRDIWQSFFRRFLPVFERFCQTFVTIPKYFTGGLHGRLNSGWSTLIFKMAVLLTVALVVGLPGCIQKDSGGLQKNASSSTFESPYEKEKKALPEKVHALFYAVKDSLDYASVTGGIDGPLKDTSEDPLPKEHLEDYDRVTKNLLAEFNREFKVDNYRVNGWDYEIVVSKRDRPDEKYMATRIKMFRFTDGKWESLGVYLHW